MKRILITLLVLTISSVAALQVLAVRAYPGMVKVTMADGSELKARIVGDEHCHFYVSESGFPLIQDEQGFFTFDDKSVEELLAQRERNLQRKRQGPGQMTTTFPTLGEQKILVILVEFADNSFSMEEPNDYYTRMLNEEGYSDNYGDGSAKDYFISNSDGRFIPSFDVYGPVKLSRNIAYYGQNNSWGEDDHPQEMTIEACRLLDDQIDFAEYDRDGDGLIDNVFIYYAGYGEHDGGGKNTIWAHSTKLSLVYKEKFIFDNVQLERYACTNELNSIKRGGLIDGIGTFCHEFCHVLGLPDLYSTTFINPDSPGAWDLMDSGNYNNLGFTPANLSSYERYALDWLDPIEMDYDEYVVLQPLHVSNQAYIFRCEDPDEYFMFENRQQEGFDYYLPGHGMLVWLINYNKEVWDNNVVNSYFALQYVDLIEADGKPGNGSRPGDPFPGKDNKTDFAYNTNPAFKGKSQDMIPYALRDIREKENGEIKFGIWEPSATSGLDSLDAKELFNGEGPIFDITGRRVYSDRLERGLYIKNGKKYLIR